MIKVGVTGSRTGMTADQRTRLIMLFEQIVEESVATHADLELHHGDCVGVDEQVAHIAKVMGFRLVSHPPAFGQYRAFIESDETRPSKPPLDRNHDIVDDTGRLIVVPKTVQEELRSGTWATYRYAMKKARPIHLVTP